MNLITRLKYISKPNKPITYGIVQCGENVHPSGVPYIRPVDITLDRGIKEGVTLQHTSCEIAKSYSRSVVSEGDIVVTIGPSYGKTMIVPYPLNGANLTQGTARVSVRHDFSVNFVRWFLLSNHAKNYWSSNLSGSTFPSLNLTVLGNTPIAIPNNRRQASIANYLDRKTTAIDHLIAKKRRLIKLLEEKRSALINHVVTKGLNPNAPMKDSGVPWIGEVPAHWDVVRVKYVCDLESGHTPSRSVAEYWEESECVIPWVSLNDSSVLRVEDYISETKVSISERGMTNSSAHLVPSGTVVFTRDATVGLAAIIERPMCLSQHIIGWVCGGSVVNEYLLCSIKCMRSVLDSLTFGATIKTIGMGDIRELRTPLPPLSEQRAIAPFVRSRSCEIDGVLSRLAMSIERLSEYRQALITAAVTGKIDVTNDPLSDDPEEASRAQMELL